MSYEWEKDEERYYYDDDGKLVRSVAGFTFNTTPKEQYLYEMNKKLKERLGLEGKVLKKMVGGYTFNASLEEEFFFMLKMIKEEK